MDNSSITYLACPYSHPNPAVRKARFKAANRAAAAMMKRGEYVFSPISHTHPMAVEGGLPTDWKFWKGYDTVMLKACGKLVVLKLDGWQVSAGVQQEIKLAKELGMRVEYVTAKQLEK